MPFSIGRPYSGYPTENVRLLYPSTGNAPLLKYVKLLCRDGGASGMSENVCVPENLCLIDAQS